MTKQELIEGLKAKTKLLYEQHHVAYMEWKDCQTIYGTADFLTCLAGEKMMTISTRIDEVNEFVELLNALED